MQNAGLDYNQILDRLTDPREKKLSIKAQTCAQQLNKGNTLDNAGLKSGLFSQSEAAIIKSALHTGTTDQIFSAIAHQHENSDNRLRTVRAKLLLPACVLILAKFITPLPSLVAGKLGAVQYLIEGSLFALLVIIVLKIILGLPTRLSLRNKQNENGLDRLLLNTPVIGNWYRRKETNKWLQLAAICLEAGLPVFDVIPTINDSLSSASIRRSFEQSQQDLLNGATVYDALKYNPCITNEALNLIHTGESSGRLAVLINHAATLEAQRLHLFEDQLTAWAPRVIYFIVVINLATGILSSPIAPEID